MLTIHIHLVLKIKKGVTPSPQMITQVCSANHLSLLNMITTYNSVFIEFLVFLQLLQKHNQLICDHSHKMK
jgi:hypothetical protein